MATQPNVEQSLLATSPQASPRAPSKGSASPEREIQKQSEDYRRSVTIVFWYKANQEPLRLQQTVPTFPYFQLTSFPTLTNNLDLSPSSYLDTYNPKSSQWEQHTIETVRLLFSQQRLLYRIRKSLLEGLSESDCVGLRDEVASQIKPPEPSPDELSSSKAGSKRPADEVLESSPPLKIVVTDALHEVRSAPLHTSNSSPLDELASQTPSVSGTAAPEAPTISNPPPPLTTNPANPPSGPQQPIPPIPPPAAGFAYRSPILYPPNDTQPFLQPPPPLPGMQFHHTPVKRWPNDYTVAEISAGFREMDVLSASTPSGGSGMTQRTAFERVFGSRYVKSTVCRHRSVWKKASQDLKDQFERMGNDQQAAWSEFVRRVEGRPPVKLGMNLEGTVFAGIAPGGPSAPPPPPPVQPQSVQPPQSAAPPAAVPASVASSAAHEPQSLTQMQKDLPNEAFRTNGASGAASAAVYDPALATQVA
ncbi:hypothetical protein AX16_000124 [Volvariella volvacea WC 439]|nr:hypothetical protein AX16_000124 [Volvariella volvacea WC 439]